MREYLLTTFFDSRLRWNLRRGNKLCRRADEKDSSRIRRQESYSCAILPGDLGSYSHRNGKAIEPPSVLQLDSKKKFDWLKFLMRYLGLLT